jgi:allantoate deiminase
MPPAAEGALGARAMALLDALRGFTDEPGRLTRLYLSPAHRAGADFVAAAMHAAGMAVRHDAVGNVVGRWQGGAPDAAPALLIGSHLDTVVDAGAYDGALGVVAGLVAVEELARREARLPFPIEVIGFGDEENVRFPTSLSTSSALVGRYVPGWLDGTDAEGIALRDALRRFGGDPDAIAALARSPGAVRAYLEVHIEQGPQLEAAGVPLGLVSAIAGATRARVRVTGEAGHAGTVPMAMRRDALAAAAEMVLAVESIARERAGLVATVGGATVRPGAVNVVPGEVEFTLDVRAGEDGAREAAVAAITAACRGIADRRGVAFDLAPFMATAATAMDVGLRATLAAAAGRLGFAPPTLTSGAGHDAAVMAALCPAAMLFVRCRGGISHNPAEAITVADADAAVRVLVETVLGLAATA